MQVHSGTQGLTVEKWEMGGREGGFFAETAEECGKTGALSLSHVDCETPELHGRISQ